MIEAFTFHTNPLNFLAMLLLSVAPKKRLWPEKDICAGPLAKVCGKLQREPVEAGHQCIAQGEESEDLFTGKMGSLQAWETACSHEIRGFCSYPLIFEIGTACQFLTISSSLLLTTNKPNKLRLFGHAAHTPRCDSLMVKTSKPGTNPSESDTVSSPVKIDKRHDTFQSIEFDEKNLGCKIQLN